MAKSTLSWTTATAILILLFTTSITAVDSDVTIEEILSDPNLSEKEMIDQLNDRYETLFSIRLLEGTDLTTFIIGFKNTAEVDKLRVTKVMTEEDLNVELKQEIEVNKNSILKGYYDDFFNLIDNKIKKFLKEQIIINDSDKESGRFEINIDQILMTHFKKMRSIFEREEEINAFYDSIEKYGDTLKFFLNTDISVAYAKWVMVISNDALTNENANTEYIDAHLNRIKKVFEFIADNEAKNPCPLLLGPDMIPVLSDIIRTYNLKRTANRKHFVLSLMKILFDYYNKGTFKSSVTKNAIINTIVRGFAFRTQEEEQNHFLHKYFRKFLIRRFREKTINLNKLADDNESIRNQVLVNMMNYLVELLATNSLREQEYLQNNYYFLIDDDFDDLMKNIEVVFNMDDNIGPSFNIVFKILCAADYDNKNTVDLEHLNHFYNLWLKVKTDHIKNLTLNNRIEMINKEIDNLYLIKYNDEESLYPIDIKKNYGLFKLIVSLYSKKVPIEVNFDDQSSAIEFYKYISEGESIILTYMENYYNEIKVIDILEVDRQMVPKLKNHIPVLIQFTIRPDVTTAVKNISEESLLDNIPDID